MLTTHKENLPEGGSQHPGELHPATETAALRSWGSRCAVTAGKCSPWHALLPAPALWIKRPQSRPSSTYHSKPYTEPVLKPLFEQLFPSAPTLGGWSTQRNAPCVVCSLSILPAQVYGCDCHSKGRRGHTRRTPFSFEENCQGLRLERACDSSWSPQILGVCRENQ